MENGKLKLQCVNFPKEVNLREHKNQCCSENEVNEYLGQLASIMPSRLNCLNILVIYYILEAVPFFFF